MADRTEVTFDVADSPANWSTLWRWVLDAAERERDRQEKADDAEDLNAPEVAGPNAHPPAKDGERLDHLTP